MKNVILLGSILIVWSVNLNAQIPNGGFEIWENYTDNFTGHNYEKPDLWVGSLPNNLVASFSIAKNPESYPLGTGQYSMKIQADLTNGVRGAAISSDVSDPMLNWTPKPSFAINYRPTSLYLYYKCFPFGGDTIIGMVYFYKNGVVIGNPSWGTTQTVSNWTAAEIPMTFNTVDIPDSATILFVTGAYVQHSESTLYLDNLSFTGFVSSVSENNMENANFSLYPNPSSDIVTLNINNAKNSELILYIYNDFGALIKTEILKQNKHQFSTKDLINGAYTIEIKSQEWSVKQKLIIQK